MSKRLLIVSCLSLVSVAYCKPYILLTSSRNKCFNVVAPPGETIEINYEAPGGFAMLQLLESRFFGVAILTLV